MTKLSGYRVMWLMLYFDLPVTTKKKRDEYTKFRNYLLYEGFEMAQFSVYMRHSASKEVAKALIKRISNNLPLEGKVYILQITDKQFETITRFECQIAKPKQKNPEQLCLF